MATSGRMPGFEGNGTMNEHCKRPGKHSRHFKILLALLAVGAIGAGVFAFTDLGATPHGWHADRHGGGISHLCSADEGRTDSLLAHAEAELEITASQQESWNRLSAAISDAHTRLQAICGELGDADTAPEKLAQAEAMMAVGTDAIREMRPAFDALYAQLDDRQRARIDDLLARRH